MKTGFADFTLDRETRLLLREGEPVHLSPKAFELLVYLVDQRPRALSKNELQELLWPNSFVSEVNLPGLVTEIRQALGDTARDPRFIRTAHRFGYAFCGSASDSAPEMAATVPSPLCWLIVNGRRVSLTEGANVLGRAPEADVDLGSPTVSRRHARIALSGLTATIEDLGSKNGTLLRNQAVSGPVPLVDGDEITMGSQTVHFRMHSGAGSTMTTG